MSYKHGERLADEIQQLLHRDSMSGLGAMPEIGNNEHDAARAKSNGFDPERTQAASVNDRRVANSPSKSLTDHR
jgi:hypothetical protein